MTVDDAVAVAYRLLRANNGATNLSDVQLIVLRSCWMGLSYVEIAERSGYEYDYIRQVGSQLWQSLSKATGEKVSKNTVRSVLEYYYAAYQNNTTISAIAPLPILNAQDWGDAIDTSLFYGRTTELTTLNQWINHDRCRLVAILGMGGMGKTALSVKIAEHCQDEFDFLIWRSLRDAPPLNEVLITLIRFFSQQQDTNLPDSDGGKLTRLMEYLRAKRCLLVLDNFDALFQPGQHVGTYREGYEGYAQLLHRIGESRHQSCLILTSREKPPEVALLQGEILLVRELSLQGLSDSEGRTLLRAKGLFGSEQDLNQLVQTYQGNPLALKITAASIQDLFGGNVAAFLQQGSRIFNGVRQLLNQQIARLSELEIQIMYWLAINREAVSVAELLTDIIPPVSTSDLLEALESLRWRSFIEKATPPALEAELFPLPDSASSASSSPGFSSSDALSSTVFQDSSVGFTQQPVVMEYMTERLIDQIYNDLITDINTNINTDRSSSTSPSSYFALRRFALLKATAKDYIRLSQTWAILNPLVRRAIAFLGSQTELAERLWQLLDYLRTEPQSTTGYAIGNIINLLCYLKTDFTGANLSHLRIWQAYLAEVDLHQVNFSHSDLSRSVFAETFGGISCVAFSPSGQWLATSDTGGESQVWDVGSGQRHLMLKTDAAWSSAVAFSPKGHLLASVGDDYQVKLWDVQTGECLQALTGHQHTIYTVAFSPDGRTLASGGLDSTVIVWHIDPASPRSEPQLQRFQGHEGRVWSVAFSPDGTTLASGAEDCTVKLWDVATGKCLHTLTDHTQWLKAVAFSPDGQWLATAGFDCTIRLWATQTWKCVQMLQGHQDAVTTVTFHPTRQQLASCSYDQTVKIWDITAGQCLRTLHDHTNRVLSVAFSPDGQQLASGGDDHATRLWNLSTGQCTKTWKGHTNGILSLDISPNGHLIATGHQDQTVKVWNPKTGQVFRTLRGHLNRVWSVAFAPPSVAQVIGRDDLAGVILASGSGDRTVRLWDGQTGQCLRIFQGHTSWVWSIAFSLSGRWLVSGSCDHTITLWDIKTGGHARTFEGHTAPVVTVLLSLDDQQIISSSADCTIRIWDIASGQCINTLQGHQNNIWSIALSPDGKQLASCSYDQTVKVWDLQTGTCLHTLEDHQGPVVSLAYSPDGQQLASGSFDQTAKLWNPNTGECLRTLRGHTALIPCLVFSTMKSFQTDEKSNQTGHKKGTKSDQTLTLISGSFDETIKVWNVDTENCLRTFRTPRPYEGMNITSVVGVSETQQATLMALGAKTIVTSPIQSNQSIPHR